MILYYSTRPITNVCSCSSNSTDTLSEQGLSILKSPIISPDAEDYEIIEENDYYKILRLDFMYYCYLFGEDHELAKSEGPLSKAPRIIMVNNHLLRLTLQAGTGRGTQWGYYYDRRADVFSRVFLCIYDQWDTMVAYGVVDKVIVRDIFDKTKYYQEISSFLEPFSEVAEPITKAEFINDGTMIKVTYLSGSEYREITETIDLPPD